MNRTVELKFFQYLWCIRRNSKLKLIQSSWISFSSCPVRYKKISPDFLLFLIWFNSRVYIRCDIKMPQGHTTSYQKYL